MPTAVANFPRELFRAPKAWAASRYNLKQWSKFQKGRLLQHSLTPTCRPQLEPISHYLLLSCSLRVLWPLRAEGMTALSGQAACIFMIVSRGTDL